MPDITSKFQKDPSITFWVILLTQRQTDRQTNKQSNKKTNKLWQKHNLLGEGSDLLVCRRSNWARCSVASLSKTNMLTATRRRQSRYSYWDKICFTRFFLMILSLDNYIVFGFVNGTLCLQNMQLLNKSHYVFVRFTGYCLLYSNFAAI